MGGNGYTDHNGNGIQDSETEQTFGHIAVAYYYDEDDDVLYGNLGWGSSYTCTSLDSFFNIQMSDYWALNLTNNIFQKVVNNFFFLLSTPHGMLLHIDSGKLKSYEIIRQRHQSSHLRYGWNND